MKKNPILTLLIFFFSLVMFLSSGCGVDGCTDPMSDNFNAEATDDDGTCIPWRDKFMGQYTVSESCPSGTYTFEINIVQGASAADAIIINNLGDFGKAVNATVNGANVNIPNQNITDQGVTASINGSGSINGNLLIINYTYEILGQGETCSMNCTKR